MKVICIEGKKPNKYGLIPDELIEGETYTVTGEYVSGGVIPCYYLAECTMGYGKFRFVPCSEISETEFERNYNKELV